MKFLAILCIALMVVNLSKALADDEVALSAPTSTTDSLTQPAPADAAQPGKVEQTEPAKPTESSKPTPTTDSSTQSNSSEPADEKSAEVKTNGSEEPKTENAKETSPSTGEVNEKDAKSTDEATKDTEKKSENQAAPDAGEDSSSTKKPEGEVTPSAPSGQGVTDDNTSKDKGTPTGTDTVPMNDDSTPQQSEDPIPASPDVVEDEGVKEAFSIISKIIGVVFTLFFALFIGCVYNYRYQMDKYKIPPFTPPKFCPEFIFPRTNRSRGTSYGYSEVEVGEYRAPNYNQL